VGSTRVEQQERAALMAVIGLFRDVGAMLRGRHVPPSQTQPRESADDDVQAPPDPPVYAVRTCNEESASASEAADFDGGSADVSRQTSLDANAVVLNVETATRDNNVVRVGGCHHGQS
jgi:hypothetical protein